MIKQFANGSKGFVATKSSSEFVAILNEFNGMVHTKLYEKMNYETYKKFQRNTDDVRIMGHEKSDILEVVVNGVVYCFKINDHSFGEYLFFHVLTEEESDIIMGQYDTYNKDYYKYDYPMTTLKVEESDTKGYYYDAFTGSLMTTNTTIANLSSTVEIADDFSNEINNLREAVEDLADKVKPVFDNEKENKNMKFANFEFGPITTDKIRMSMYGMAVKNANGEYVAYSNGEIINVDILNFDGSKFMYKMPVAIKDVAVGDVVIHMRKPMIIIERGANGFVAVDVYEGEAKTIIPTKSPFGFHFMTKIVSLMDMCGGTSTATVDAPFGNMLPFLLMSENADIDPMMAMLMMGGKIDMSNPMMMYFLMKDNGNMEDILPLMFMMGNAVPAVKPATAE